MRRDNLGAKFFGGVFMAYVKKQNLTNLTKARQAAGISRKKLAELSGVSARAIETYEQGKVNINDASVSRVRDLARAIGVPIEQIMNE